MAQLLVDPLACSAANALLDVLEAENLIEAAREKGDILLKGLDELHSLNPKIISEVRGRGLMQALVCHQAPNKIIQNFREEGLLVVGAAENAIRFLRLFKHYKGRDRRSRCNLFKGT